MRFFRSLNLDWAGRTSLALALGLVTIGQAAGAAAKRPNILFIMADDLGWMDLACQGNKLVETPNIDRLARQGMRFTSAYAAAPVCSPTRGGGAHRSGAGARAYDVASARAIFPEGQPASAGGHDAGDWPRTHYNRRAVEEGRLRERVSRQVAHRTERRAAGEGGTGAFAAQSGIRHQYRRRVVRRPAEFLLSVPQCNAAGRRAGRVPARPVG